MKILTLLLTIVFIFSMSNNSFSHYSEDTLISKLEEAEKKGILKKDAVQLANLMSKNIVVQNPENAIIGFQQIMDRIKSGKINYSVFERKIEHIAFVNGIAIVMGLETLIPKVDTQNTAKTVKRRFTNIWTKENENWKLTARQATIVSFK